MKKVTVKKILVKEDREKLNKHNDFLSHLLFHRGIKTHEESEKFLNPDYEKHTHDPYLMKDMDKAVERIIKAIKNNEKTIIYSDYDADGIPGAVVLHDFFKKIGYLNFENYIPHRHEEGFGLNHDAVEEFGKKEVRLLITIDCGITDVEEVDRANGLGIETIITDHHLPGEKLPKAFAILDSKQPSCEYPDKNLCGAGVVFKFIQAILKKDRFGLKEGTEKWFLDMVGLATLSDMVPLLGENRVFAHYGLKVIRKSPRLGLKKLLQKIKVDQKNITEDDIGFMITPRINAASRMGAPEDAFNLLTAVDENMAEKLSEHLNHINNERKGIVASMVKEMKHLILERYGDANNGKVIVLGNPKWKPSLLGLVANTLAEEHSTPVFLWGREGGETLKGSCRSVGVVNLLELMQGTSDFFLDFGGHKMSGGFTLSIEKAHLLPEKLQETFEKMKNKNEIAEDEVDMVITVDDVNWENYKHIEKMSPFGVSNEKPLFLLKNILIHEMKQFGKEKNHLELILKSEEPSLAQTIKKISAIGFFSHPETWGNKIKVGDKINLVATMEKSVFKNYPELRLRIVDIF